MPKTKVERSVDEKFETFRILLANNAPMAFDCINVEAVIKLCGCRVGSEQVAEWKALLDAEVGDAFTALREKRNAG